MLLIIKQNHSQENLVVIHNLCNYLTQSRKFKEFLINLGNTLETYEKKT